MTRDVSERIREMLADGTATERRVSLPAMAAPVQAPALPPPRLADYWCAMIRGWCSHRGLPLPVGSPGPEFTFSGLTKKRKWRFDLAWVERQVAMEFEGGAGKAAFFSGRQGRHTRPEGFESDCAKYSEAGLLGWRVLRCTYSMLDRGDHWPWLEFVFREAT